MTIGLLGFFSLPFLLGGITSFRSTSTETQTGVSDTAPLGNGLLALCGAGNCSGLSPSTVHAFDISGQWTRQFLWCEDTPSIECEEPVRRLEDEGGEESAISFVLDVERNEGTETDRLRSLSLQIFDSNGTEEVGIIANATIDGLWWTMNDDSSYVKIRWSPNDGTYFNESWHNEDVFVFSGLTSVETVPSSTTPVCFSEETTRKYEALPDNERTGVIDHILSETATREILRSSYLNTFFTNGIMGNPYRSVHTVGESSLLLEEAVQAMADDDSPFVSLQCAEGTLDDGAPEVTIANFLASPGLQADRVHVVGAGEFFWETEEEIATEYFTNQEWEGEDVLTVVFLGVVLVCVLSGVMYEECRPDVKNPRTPGLLTMAGSLVGRIALVLIMAEGSIFLADSSRGVLENGRCERTYSRAATK
ncbi:unnamed protein product [Ectocarpus sp. 12 AP-2014]